MIRLVLYSPDNKLQSWLASALKSEYEVVLESNSENLRQVIQRGAHDRIRRPPLLAAAARYGREGKRSG